jgi:hypothetical protein
MSPFAARVVLTGVASPFRKNTQLPIAIANITASVRKAVFFIVHPRCHPAVCQPCLYEDSNAFRPRLADTEHRYSFERSATAKYPDADCTVGHNTPRIVKDKNPPLVAIMMGKGNRPRGYSAILTERYSEPSTQSPAINRAQRIFH